MDFMCLSEPYHLFVFLFKSSDVQRVYLLQIFKSNHRLLKPLRLLAFVTGITGLFELVVFLQKNAFKFLNFINSKNILFERIRIR